MPLPTWPSTVPHQPLVSGFAYGDFRSPAVVTEVEDGPPIQRVGALTLIERLPYKVRMTGDQLATWRAWWRDDLGHGVARFSMSVPIDGAYVTRTVQIAGGVYSAQPVDGDNYDLAFTLLVFPAA